MKALVTSTLAAIGLLAGQAQAQAPAPKDPSGVWLTKDGRARIRVEKCGPANAEACGYVVWLKDPLTDDGRPRTDIKNPDPSKRGRPAIGLQLMSNLKLDKEGRYAGQIYNAEEGKHYDVSIYLENPNELRIRGCFMGFLCGSQGWSRVTDVAQGQLTGPTGGPNGPKPDVPAGAKNGGPATTGSTGTKAGATASTSPARP